MVIPVKNGAAWLDDCIKGILNQTLIHETEIIAIDSGSTDRSVEILKKYPVRRVSIAPDEFNHGLTRNYGAQLSRGEYVVMTVQDAKPADDMWLQKLMIGFSAAENVAGVCGNQVVPHDPDKNPVDWHRPINDPLMRIVQYKRPADFEALTPAQKMAACSWDDVTAMYRKDVLLQIPFHKISCSEDTVWAKEALLAGYALVYNPAAKVYHYHHGDKEFTFRRTLTVMHTRYRQFGFLYNRPKQSLRQLASMVKTIQRSAPLTFKEKWNWFWYNREQLKGWQKAHHVFSKALKKSEANLDAVHEEICGRPQMHQKKSV